MNTQFIGLTGPLDTGITAVGIGKDITTILEKLPFDRGRRIRLKTLSHV